MLEDLKTKVMNLIIKRKAYPWVVLQADTVSPSRRHHQKYYKYCSLLTHLNSMSRSSE